jgi:hypothetical protein
LCGLQRREGSPWFNRLAEGETFTGSFSYKRCRYSRLVCRYGDTDNIGGHVSAVAGETELTITFPERAVLERYYQVAFSVNRDAEGHAVKGLVFELNDGGGDIGADHTVFPEADAGSDEAELNVGVVALRKQLLCGYVQGTVDSEYGWQYEELFQAGVAVEVEAPQVREMIPAGLYK